MWIVVVLSACSIGEDVAAEGSVDEEALAEAAQDSKGGSVAKRLRECRLDPRVELGLVSPEVCVGADLFFRETFNGNGRSCATCHPALHNFTIDPDFIATLPPSDPLFVAEQKFPLAQLEKPALMRQFGLILENLDGLNAPTTRFVMRSVPHTFGLAVSVTAPPLPTPDGTTIPPLDRTGWSGDGAPGLGELRDFQTGAVTQHYTKSLNRKPGIDFRLPSDDELDAIVAFMSRIGRTNDLDLTQVRLTDPAAEAGRLVYLDPVKRCNGCHRNAGANNGANVNRNFNTGIERARIPALSFLGIPFDGGFGNAPSPDHDSNGDGKLDSFGNGTFNTPPLIEAADTGPFFHTNAFSKLEDAIRFYSTSAFAISPAGNGQAIPLNSTEVNKLGRFLRVLNASMNAQLAIFRVEALITIAKDRKNKDKFVQQKLAELARVEVEDAIRDLSVSPTLNETSRKLLEKARSRLYNAEAESRFPQRLTDAEEARDALRAADTQLGSRTGLVMGAGSLMF